ncbi:MAG: TlpA disulfide reductase family protein [Pseudomonadales bacterium]
MRQRPASDLRHALAGVALFAALLLIPGCAGQNDPALQHPLEAYRGKWVVLNYWAEWCGPCIEEIPELNRLQQAHGERITVLGVNFDRIEGEPLAALAAQMGIGFEVLQADPSDALRLSRPSALPTTYLFHPNSELAAVLVGPQSADELLGRIRQLEKNTPGDR